MFRAFSSAREKEFGKETNEEKLKEHFLKFKARVKRKHPGVVEHDVKILYDRSIEEDSFDPYDLKTPNYFLPEH